MLLRTVLGAVSGWYDASDYYGKIPPIICAMIQGTAGGWIVGWMIRDVAIKEQVPIVRIFFGSLIKQDLILVVFQKSHQE